MRRHLSFIALGLILVAIGIVFLRPSAPEKTAPTPAAARVQTPASRSHREPSAQPPAASEITAPPQPTPAVTAAEDSPPGLQLSLAVPLPAAAVAQTDPALLTPGATALREEIITGFYQDLAKTFGPNATIQPGPEVNAALARANERFRSYFGDTAYQAQLLASAQEVLIPEASTPPK